jgi:hypothetical protein
MHTPGCAELISLRRARKQRETCSVANLETMGWRLTEPGDHGLGRPRGGCVTELHLVVERGQKPMTIAVTAGQRGDSPQLGPV